jgi:hypothetical protein
MITYVYIYYCEAYMLEALIIVNLNQVDTMRVKRMIKGETIETGER